MAESVMYHRRQWTCRITFDSRRISDRLEEKLMRREFTADDRLLHRKRCRLSSSRRRTPRPSRLLVQGRRAGVRALTGPVRARIPRLRGNGMFKSLGNIVRQCRCRPAVHRHAGQAETPACQRQRQVERQTIRCWPRRRRAVIVRVTARAIFPNCRATFRRWDRSSRRCYAPTAESDAPEPAGKGFEDFKDCIHRAADPSARPRSPAKSSSRRFLSQRQRSGHRPCGIRRPALSRRPRSGRRPRLRRPHAPG